MIWFLVGLAVGAVLVLVVMRRRPVQASPAPQVAPTALEEPSDALPAVLDALPLAVVVFDPDGAETSRNESAVAFTGVRHQDVLLDAAMTRVARAAIDGHGGSEQMELAGPPEMIVQVSAVQYRRGAIVLMEDITERILVDRIRTDFVANVSHELRTPVGAMSILAETLAGETEDELVRSLAARMVAESERMSRTIDDLLELSRIEMGGEMSVAPVDLAEVVREAVERVAHRASREGVGIECRVSSGSITVPGDHFQLVTAVSNLVDNAVKYSEGRGPVTVTVGRTDDAVEVSVADTGIGIPVASLERIFERFYRVDRARTRTTGGTGLGLSIVKRVVSNHGGEVNVTSREGEGSTFTLRFPVQGIPEAGMIRDRHERSNTDE
ncbi:MAG: sensor histidine kinase [Ilumatobacteraceae bacterium]